MNGAYGTALGEAKRIFTEQRKGRWFNGSFLSMSNSNWAGKCEKSGGEEVRKGEEESAAFYPKQRSMALVTSYEF